MNSLNLQEISPGKAVRINIPTHQSFCGEAINIPFFVCKSSNPGPVLGITAGIHGDEINGIRAAQRLVTLFERNPAYLKSGAVVIVPIVNFPAYIKRSRFMWDGSDLNRLFDGSDSPGARYAKVISEILSDTVSHHIDIHTARSNRTNCLYLRVGAEDKVGHTMGLCFAPDALVVKTSDEGTFRGCMEQKGIPIITVEAGSGGCIEPAMIDRTVKGLCNILSWLKQSEADQSITSPIYYGSRLVEVRAELGGIIEIEVTPGELIENEKILGSYFSSTGKLLGQAIAPTGGFITGITRYPVVEPGERIVSISPVERIYHTEEDIRAAISSG